ncbi:DivIVA domain-containing protein [Rudaeicoccus suwonensis]|uniref:Cell wall synthesis protein Wag31 n=1 Tax=Rudaeicoccus suwonensis TaxID=657409 RepID=A0A561E9V8_9MICO|nr:DivIVA domain-containing protein [Rudaeicoccus suwonensis]TWE12404.1 DivIVA domain-containing protein [Rudaeicoccus suwonensis]
MTPDDVVRTEFGSGGRRGYDPREVDDFLDEVVHRMRGGK